MRVQIQVLNASTSREINAAFATNSNAAGYWRSLETLAPTFNVKPIELSVRDADEVIE
jgi:hypothetical protein